MAGWHVEIKIMNFPKKYMKVWWRYNVPKMKISQKKNNWTGEAFITLTFNMSIYQNKCFD